MGIKPKIHPIQDLPGPASYKTKTKLVLQSAPAFTLRMKPDTTETFKTPGISAFER